MPYRTATTIVFAFFLSACGSTQTSFLPFDYRVPDQAMIAVLQHVTVTDMRPSEDIVVSTGKGKHVFRPVPAIANYLALTFGETLLRDHPAFAESLTRSRILLRVRIDDISGNRAASSPGELLMVAF